MFSHLLGGGGVKISSRVEEIRYYIIDYGNSKKNHKYNLCDNMVCIHDYDMRKYAYKLQQDNDDCNLFDEEPSEQTQ